jgi:hypothetical protein
MLIQSVRHLRLIIPARCGAIRIFQLKSVLNSSPFAKVSYFGSLFTDEPLPKDGYVELPYDKPGFGVTLNR